VDRGTGGKASSDNLLALLRRPLTAHLWLTRAVYQSLTGFLHCPSPSRGKIAARELRSVPERKSRRPRPDGYDALSLALRPTSYRNRSNEPSTKFSACSSLVE